MENRGIILRRATMAIILLLSLGYLTLWAIAGLSIDQKFYNRVASATNSAYFGSQGTMILLYTTPVLLVSVLACLYLHLRVREIQNPRSIRTSSTFALWRQRPMIVKGLGIVSWTELTIFVLFVSFLVWDFVNYLMLFGKRHHHQPEENHKLYWATLMKTVGVTLGCVGDFCIAFLFFPVTRGSSVLALFGLSSEGSIKYHIWLGHITMFIFTAHGLAFVVPWICWKKWFRR